MKKILTKKDSLKSTGFTLIEILVSLTLLSIVIVVAVGLLATTNAQVRQTRQERRVMDNLTFSIEHLSRAISYGHDYACSSVPGAPAASCSFSQGLWWDALTFQGVYLGTSTPITYERLINTGTGRGYIARSIGSAAAISLTDNMVDIQELTFYVSHAEPYGADPEQPRVTVVIRGISYASVTPKSFIIQTTLSQRDLKLK